MAAKLADDAAGAHVPQEHLAVPPARGKPATLCAVLYLAGHLQEKLVLEVAGMTCMQFEEHTHLLLSLDTATSRTS